MKIVVLDGYTENPGDISWAPLEALGDVTVYDRTSYAESPLIAERIGTAEIAVTNKTPLTRAVIDACPNLRAIAVLATGYNVVDTVYARTKGIPVMNVPAYGTDNTAQYAVALLLEACSHVGLHDRSVHAGEWTESADFCYWKRPLIEVSGKTAGIIGFGRIGMAVARVLRAMNAARISQMKDGVIIVNNGRGPLIVESDLAAALACGKVGCAAVDVASTEPIRADNPLLHAPNCIITPHISWATKEARERIMQTTADNVKSFMAGKPAHVVN